jgi:hypothetical protein
MKFVMSTDPERLLEYLKRSQHTATVEAEYGDVLVPGTVITMAHHGIHAGQPAPCSYPNGCVAPDAVELVGLSHFDLDTIGGCMALLGTKTDTPGFWELAEFVDLNGPHKLQQSGASAENVRRLYAFWAWHQESNVRAPQDGSVIDVTHMIESASLVIECICADNADYLADGDDLRVAGEVLNAGTFIEMCDGVVLRVGSVFMNHLYSTPNGLLAEAVVAFNTVTGGITVSFADTVKGRSARVLLQSLFGVHAGGHDGIAGSPRGVRMSLADLQHTYMLTCALIRTGSKTQVVS